MKHNQKKISSEPGILRLNKKEIVDPGLVLEEFFQYVTLPQAHEKLWEWLESTVTGSFNKELNRRERCNLVYFYQRLEKLLEAAYTMHTRSLNKKSSGKQK